MDLFVPFFGRSLALGIWNTRSKFKIWIFYVFVWGYGLELSKRRHSGQYQLIGYAWQGKILAAPAQGKILLAMAAT